MKLHVVGTLKRLKAKRVRLNGVTTFKTLEANACEIEP